MKLKLLFWGLLLLLISCKKSAEKTNEVRLQQYREAISLLADKKPTSATANSILKVWHRYNKNALIQSDTGLYARVKYNLGKMTARTNPDTSKIYLQQGLDLVEQSQQYNPTKASIYSGMGNLANAQGLEHQANYYYNKAALIVLSDTTADLSPAAKCIMLLAAAQSNESLQQYNLAYKMNLAALKLLPQLPANSIFQQRVLVQLISVIYSGKFPKESVEKYFEKLEKLHATYPGEFNPRFLYDSKILYFDQKNQVDTILKYVMLNAEIDEEIYRHQPDESVAVSNLYITYSNIANQYLEKKDYKNVVLFLNKADKIYEKKNQLIAYEDLVRNREINAAYYTAIGKPYRALQFSKQALALQSDNFKAENIQAIAEMNALYQLQAKDNSIGKLNEDIKVNSLKLERNRLILLIAILVVLLLLIFIFLFYSIYRQRKLKQEKENVQLQQQLLRTQMEPHFIFNTLSVLQSFIRFDEKDKAIKYLNQFSRLLRSSLELSREKRVPLSQEVEALENYLSLQQMRYNNVFSFRMNIPTEEDLDTIMLPPMLIQPFVENAIIHGINLSDEASFVHVDFTLNEQVLKVTIADSGTKNEQQPERKHPSLSGIISKERLQLLGRERNQNAGIYQAKNESGGTTVTLDIPISPME